MTQSKEQRVASAIVDAVASRLSSNRGYLRVPELATPFPIADVLRELAVLEEPRPRVAIFGVKPPSNSHDLAVTTSVEEAIGWRDDPSHSSPLLVIGDLEREKAAGLQSIRTLRDRDVRSGIFARTRSVVRQLEMPLAVDKLLQRVEAEVKVDLLSCADYCVALEAAGTKMSEVARTDLWRVGLLPDTQSPDVDRTRLIDNLGLVDQIRTSDAGTVQRLLGHLEQGPYRAVRDYAAQRKKARLASLEYSDVKAAFRSASKTSAGGGRKTRDRDVDTTIFSLTEDPQFSEDGFLQQLVDREGSEGSEAAENGAVNINGTSLSWEATAVEPFAEWLSPSGTQGYAEVGGGTVDVDARALHADSQDDSVTWSNLRQAADTLRTLEGRATDDVPLRAAMFCEQLIEHRVKLLPYLAHIPLEGVRLFGASPQLFDIADGLIASWVQLWNELLKLSAALPPEDREYVGQVGTMLADLDVRLELEAGDVRAHLLPLHPIVVEPRVAAARVLRNHAASALDDEFIELLSSSVDPGLPGIMVEAGGVKRPLSYSGTFKNLPLYEARPRQAEGVELTRTVQQIIERFVNVHPYTALSLSVCLVGPSPRLAKALMKWLSNRQQGRIRIDVFADNRDVSEMQATVDEALEEIGSTEAEAERLHVRVHADAQVPTLPRRLRSEGVQPHLVVAFDLSEIKAGSYSGNLPMPLQGSVITQWAFNVNPISRRPVIRPTSGSGRLIQVSDAQQELTGLGPPSMERSPLLSERTASALGELSSEATWVALCEGASPLAAPPALGELKLLGRSISGGHVSYVYSAHHRMLLEPVLQYLQRSTWIHPEKSELADFLLRTIRMALPEGLLGFFKASGSLSNESVLGRLGVAAAIAYLSDEVGVERFTVSLDSLAARQWLNLRSDSDKRADLLTFSWDADDHVTVTAVEVKARTEPLTWSGSEEPQVVTEARSQVEEMTSLLRKIFGLAEADSLTPSRREVLKRQVFLEALQQWDGLRAEDPGGYERRIRALGSLFDRPSQVSVEGKIVVVSTNETSEAADYRAHSTAPVVVLGVPWLRRALQGKDGGRVEIPTELLDQFSEMFDDGPPATVEGPLRAETEVPATDALEDGRGHEPAVAAGPTSTGPVVESATGASTHVDDTVGGPEDVDQLAEEVRDALLARNAPLQVVDPKRATVGPSVIVIPFKLARGARLSNLQSQEVDLARDLQVSAVRVSNWSGASGYAAIELPRKERVISDVSQASLGPRAAGDPLQVVIGTQLNFSPFSVKLDDLPHLLVAGTTGSGKSVFLRSLLWQLTHFYRPDELDLVIIDAKGMADYLDFKKAPHIKSEADFHLGVQGAVDVLADIVENRLPARRDVFNAYASEAIDREPPVQITNVSGLLRDAAERGVAAPLRPLVVFVDEFAELVVGSAERKRFEALVTRFNQIARAIGGHLIAATQRPSADVVTGVIKGNFSRLALRVRSGVDSRVILDEVGAESLLGRGDLLFQSPEDGLIRLQGFNAPGPYRFKST